MPSPRLYDFIGFGDEVPGILALVSAAREHRRQTGSYPRSLLIFKGNGQIGIGGHLVRGRLSYLDRSHVPLNIRQSLGLGSFGDAPSLYKEFCDEPMLTKLPLIPIEQILFCGKCCQKPTSILWVGWKLLRW